MKRPTYKAAVAWIADNDEPTVTEVEDMEGLISVVLVAELFGVEPQKVAKDVIRHREKSDE